MKILPSKDIKSLYEKMMRARSIVLATHARPDGDAVGSCAATLSWLHGAGVGAKAVIQDRPPASLDFITRGIPEEDFIFFDGDPDAARRAVGEADLIVFLDMNRADRAGDGLGAAIEASPAEKALVDHHPGLEPGRFSPMFSETEVSSTCELLYYILKAMPGSRGAESLPRAAATALMAGMTTDTNNFANSVFPTTLTMASELIEAGVDRDAIVAEVFNSYGIQRIRLMGHLLNKRLRITPDGVAYMILTRRAARRFDLQEGDTEGFVNIPLTAAEVRMSLFLREEKGRFRVSIRSKRGISASDCAARYFHGGGHVLASGGRLNVPDDVRTAAEAAAYIERATHEFMTEQSGNEQE